MVWSCHYWPLVSASNSVPLGLLFVYFKSTFASLILDGYCPCMALPSHFRLMLFSGCDLACCLAPLASLVTDSLFLFAISLTFSPFLDFISLCLYRVRFLTLLMLADQPLVGDHRIFSKYVARQFVVVL